MPIARIVVGHEAARVCFGICSLHAIRVNMTFNARRITAFRIVTRHAALNIAPCELGVLTAAGADSDGHKSCRFMACRNCSS
jgi:hypothetical protein